MYWLINHIRKKIYFFWRKKIMTNNVNATKATETIRSAQEFIIHKAVGKVRENCVYAESLDQVPQFLIEDGAIVPNEDGSITLYAVECPATRNFPVYVCWEEVSAENADKVPGKFGSWSKDNGDTTLKVVDGKCYNLPSMVKATLITEVVPEWVTEAGFPLERNGEDWELTRTDWGGEVRKGAIGKALWCSYGEGDVNILALAEKSAAEYIVTIDGEDVGILTDLA